MQRRIERLWPENVDAWEIWQHLASPVAVQFHFGPWLLEALTPGWSADDRVSLVHRLDLIYAALRPRDGGAHTQD